MRCENSLYCVFIIVRVMNTSLIPLITIFYGHFSLDIYLVEEISFRLCFQQVYSVGESLCCYTRLIPCICLMFHPYLVSHLLGARPKNVTWVNV